ncbi:MAG: DUF808 domain-containing protein [Moraxellaceae bacterium]|nr:DUF808 domain-containing protein [Moraxellaceae bacterium]
MAGASLLLLLDDMALIMDDVSVMTKVAAKNTAGVLGDDLALNAEQVTGVRAERELPVVWAVAKGSLVNKIILVPLALLLSWVFPPLITALLMCGGIFLCFEGSEKVVHTFGSHDEEHEEHKKANADKKVDMVAFEKAKIKGAIRTDFILSAEIIVIALGSAGADATFISKAIMLSVIAVAITVGVYGIVALIVKMDDMGLYLVQQTSKAKQALGKFLLAFAPKLMKFLSIAGTIAMFLVGGGILYHNIPALHHLIEPITHLAGGLSWLLEPLLIGVLGFIIGLIVMGIVAIIGKVRGK